MKLTTLFAKKTYRNIAAVISLTMAMVIGLIMVGPAAGARTQAVAAAAPTTLAATGATYTFSQQPDANMNNLSFARVSSSQEAMFVKFDAASALGAGRTVQSAVLRVKIRTISTTKPGVQVRPVVAVWNPSTLTYRNRPVRSAKILNTPVLPKLGTTLSIPLTDLSTINRVGPTSFELSYSSAAPILSIFTDGVDAPSLVLTLSAAPTPPPTTPSPTQTPTVSATPTATPTVSATPTATPTPSTSPAPTSTSSAPSPGVDFSKPLSFNLPARSSHQRLVFAHYFPPYPISIDNKASAADYYAVNYLKPSGEAGRFASVGGLLRDRPMGRATVAGDWKLEDAKTEIRQAKAAGIDGWTVNILGLTGANWDRVVHAVDAADAVGGFKIMLNLDMNSGAGTAASSVVADQVVSLAKRPSIYRIGSADFVLGAFKAEAKTPAWWKALMIDITAKTGLKVNFIPTVLNVTANIDKFAPISYGIGNWGVRNPGNITAGPNYALRAHNLGIKWMAPVAVQDERPNQKMYDEAGNTETLKASWQRAIADQADLIQLVTWNDYSEGTSFGPSVGHGYSFLDINAYSMSQFQTKQQPQIVRDAIYVTHRIQKYAKNPSYTHQLMVLPGYQAGLAARDTVEVLTYLTAPAEITVVIGSKSYVYTAPAGVNTKLYPLEIGNVKASGKRSAVSIGVADSPYTVSATPYNQDLAYYAVSSRRVNP